MMTIDQIERLFDDYFSKLDSGQDQLALITMFVGSANSPLAACLFDMAHACQARDIEVNAVFATSDHEQIAAYEDKLAAEMGDGRCTVRVVAPRQFRSQNEQLVLGNSSYISGSTIGETASAGALDASALREEVAVATFAFDLLWKSSSPFTPGSGGRHSAKRYQVSLVGVLLGIGGALFQRLRLPQSNPVHGL